MTGRMKMTLEMIRDNIRSQRYDVPACKKAEAERLVKYWKDAQKQAESVLKDANKDAWCKESVLAQQEYIKELYRTGEAAAQSLHDLNMDQVRMDAQFKQDCIETCNMQGKNNVESVFDWIAQGNLYKGDILTAFSKLSLMCGTLNNLVIFDEAKGVQKKSWDEIGMLLDPLEHLWVVSYQCLNGAEDGIVWNDMYVLAESEVVAANKALAYIIEHKLQDGVFQPQKPIASRMEIVK